MNRERGVLATVIKCLMPLVAIVALVLYDYVTVGTAFKFDFQNITKIVLVCVCLTFVYLPLKDVFLSMLLNSNRTVAKENAYAASVVFIRKGHNQELADFCKYEYDSRRKCAVEAVIRNSLMTFAEFAEKYKFDIKAVWCDKQLSFKERTVFIKAIREENKIKSESIKTIMPGAGHGGTRRRIHSNAQKQNTGTTVRKLITCSLSATMLVAITFSGKGNADAYAIIARTFLIVALVLWYAFSSLLAASSVVRTYNDELTEKSQFLSEFFEHCKLNPDTKLSDEQMLQNG